MRLQTHMFLSDYALGNVSLEQLRDFVEDVDWDDPSIPEDERDVLLNVEVRLVGFDEGFNEEADIGAFLANAIPVFLSWDPSPEPIVIMQANNQTAIPSIETIEIIISPPMTLEEATQPHQSPLRTQPAGAA